MAQEPGEASATVQKYRIALSFYSLLYNSLVESLVKYLEKALGESAGVYELGTVLEDSIVSLGEAVRKLAESMGRRLETVDDLLQFVNHCHEMLNKLGVSLELFRASKMDENHWVMETRGCRLLKSGGESIARIIPLAIVAGFVKSLGHEARWLISPSHIPHLCRAISIGLQPKYEYIVYYDEGVQPPACKIVIEKLDCSKYQ